MTTPSSAYEGDGGESRAITVNPPTGTASPVPFQLDAGQVAVLRHTVARDADDAELNLFVQFCMSKALDPFTGQVYFVKYQGKPSFIIGIDGFRALAERGGNYDGQDEPEFRAQGGEWSTDWDEDEPPYEARVTVYRKGSTRPISARAKLSAYAGYKSKANGGGLNQFWGKMPELMLAKCAESLALRKAFPDATAGLHTAEEMNQAGVDDDHMRGQLPKEAAEEFPSQKPKALEGEVVGRGTPAPVTEMTEADRDHEQLMTGKKPEAVQVDPKTMQDKPAPQEQAPPAAQEEEPLPPEPEGPSAPAQQPAATQTAVEPKAPRTAQQFFLFQKERGHTLATMLKIFDVERSADLKAAVKKATIAGSMLKVEAYEFQAAAAIADGADVSDDLPFDDPEPEA